MRVTEGRVVAVAASLVVALSLVLAGVLSLPSDPGSTTDTTDDPPPSDAELACKRSDPSADARCFEGTVSRVLDGDTLEVDSEASGRSRTDRIRLVLVDAPELTEAGGAEARDFLTALCLGKGALVDEDDFQVGADPFGRILAVVRCDGRNANAEAIAAGVAETYHAFCSSSEFEDEAWSGCGSPPAEEECDPAYPDVCIPPPPPDLDCADIPYRNFTVLPPDPHHFDGDGDGIGCET